MDQQRAPTRSRLWSRIARDTLQESQGVINWTSDSADAEVFHAIPLTGPNLEFSKSEFGNSDLAESAIAGRFGWWAARAVR